MIKELLETRVRPAVQVGAGAVCLGRGGCPACSPPGCICLPAPSPSTIRITITAQMITAPPAGGRWWHPQHRSFDPLTHPAAHISGNATSPTVTTVSERPRLQEDGGDIQYRSFDPDSGVVTVKLMVRGTV